MTVNFASKAMAKFVMFTIRALARLDLAHFDLGCIASR